MREQGGLSSEGVLVGASGGWGFLANSAHLDYMRA